MDYETRKKLGIQLTKNELKQQRDTPAYKAFLKRERERKAKVKQEREAAQLVKEIAEDSKAASE